MKEVYDDIKAHFGMVPNIFQARGAIDADWLELNWKRVKKIVLQEGPLDRKTEELFAYTVSEVKGCEYCSLAHESMAKMVGASERGIKETK